MSVADGKLVLLVDDEEANRELLADILQAQGHRTELAKDGYEALAKLELDVDLVLLDAMMPGMDGFEVARFVREHPEAGDDPIIMVTALDTEEDRLRAVEAGANDFIGKPVDRAELYVRTGAQLRLKQARDALKNQQALDGGSLLEEVDNARREAAHSGRR